jgi:hypothetical protein
MSRHVDADGRSGESDRSRAVSMIMTPGDLQSQRCNLFVRGCGQTNEGRETVGCRHEEPFGQETVDVR